VTASVRKTEARLADGRDLFYYGAFTGELTDTRPLQPAHLSSQARYDPLLDDWVLITGHRNDRPNLPPDTECPLCPSKPGRPTEVPAASYEVVVFQNRYSALTPESGGRCEVVIFSPQHDTSFADLTPAQASLVLAAWTDRTAELSRQPGIRQVYCFENRGREIGVSLSHPHGQIYAYPFITARTSRMLAAARAHRERTGSNIFDDILRAERAGRAGRAEGTRIVASGTHWTAFVPFAARWPFEVHLYPNRRVPDLTCLTEEEQNEFCGLYLDILRRFDRLFDSPAPYISAWHQAPSGEEDEFALHLELFTIRRSKGKLKYLAGTESGMDAFTNDIAPEDAARRLREIGQDGSTGRYDLEGG
jgi:UDPglucose--hexose-1-phosphate uridylyltransferase